MKRKAITQAGYSVQRTPAELGLINSTRASKKRAITSSPVTPSNTDRRSTFCYHKDHDTRAYIHIYEPLTLAGVSPT